mmetsp:Transcript_36607/g.103363  ORF Transcript_36607/g.103363 Transcript_36607/m.103363 type:complete len:467 (-) Transcript_36607:528-1928(-)
MSPAPGVPFLWIPEVVGPSLVPSEKDTPEEPCGAAAPPISAAISAAPDKRATPGVAVRRMEEALRPRAGPGLVSSLNFTPAACPWGSSSESMSWSPPLAKSARSDIRARPGVALRSMEEPLRCKQREASEGVSRLKCTEAGERGPLANSSLSISAAMSAMSDMRATPGVPLRWMEAERLKEGPGFVSGVNCTAEEGVCSSESLLSSISAAMSARSDMRATPGVPFRSKQELLFSGLSVALVPSLKWTEFSSSGTARSGISARPGVALRWMADAERWRRGPDWGSSMKCTPVGPLVGSASGGSSRNMVLFSDVFFSDNGPLAKCTDMPPSSSPSPPNSAAASARSDISARPGVPFLCMEGTRPKLGPGFVSSLNLTALPPLPLLAQSVRGQQLPAPLSGLSGPKLTRVEAGPWELPSQDFEAGETRTTPGVPFLCKDRPCLKPSSDLVSSWKCTPWGSGLPDKSIPN